MFFAIQVMSPFSPAFRTENPRASLRDLIRQNNLDFPNKLEVLCQDFSYQLTGVRYRGSGREEGRGRGGDGGRGGDVLNN